MPPVLWNDQQDHEELLESVLYVRDVVKKRVPGMCLMFVIIYDKH